MPKLEIHLLEGFADNDVEIRANGRSAARLQHVSTNYSIGVAANADVEVPNGPCHVQVAVKGLTSASTDLTVRSDTYLSVRLDQGSLHFTASETPPAYL